MGEGRKRFLTRVVRIVLIEKEISNVRLEGHMDIWRNIQEHCRDCSMGDHFHCVFE